ncbi:AP2-like ethylene-responsive transcription factor AIL5 isoform X2 [Prosopis cineraria]|uniref:AP2-like ethylene-responsive transcription factor AIL5 isoform X2 n=1 Tax=Prosopis cineraria TaxID=364024 RepID=UPI00240FD7C9|nr:AP2-like ethylene-responsive transcription factor AIL5 isoform X2 [Prosopis cineraria]
MDSYPNWLAFSLSNHSPLFHSFSSGTTDDASPQAAVGGPATSNDLSIFAGGSRKFEDFLGGSSASSVADATAPPPQFSADNVFSSDLKTIAAGFLPRLAAAEQAEPRKQALAVTVPSPRKTADTFGQRTSIYRGVTRHRWTGRYEAHLWDNSCRREGQSRKGRQGGYDKEERAARAYDLAALKYWGPTTTTNFQISNYEKELEEMKNMTRQEFVASLRRKSSGFSRGASIYRGVTRHHQHGRWQARIGRVAGNKDLYLGTFSTQEEAAEAYDIAAIKFRGLSAVTNFDMSRYDVKSIANSSLPIGGLSSKAENSSDSSASDSKSNDGSLRSADSNNVDRDPSSHSSVTFTSPPSTSNHLSFAVPIIKQDPTMDYWSNILGYHQNPPSLKNPSNTVTLASLQNYNNNNTMVPFSLELQRNSNALMDGGVINAQNIEQQQSGSNNNNSSTGTVDSSLSSVIALGTPIGLNSNSSYESSSGYGNWSVGPGLRTFQTHAKGSLFQTPIFGME